MKTILIIEDEKNISELIRYNLESEGFNTIVAFDGISGITSAYVNKPDLIILDIMLPEKNGYDICEEIRGANMNVPIIILSAKTGELDRIKGLDIGADDYVLKPFSIKELISRVKAHIRRDDRNKEKSKAKYTLAFEDLYIDKQSHIVTVGDKNIELTSKEYDIVCFLLENQGNVYSRNELLDALWGIDYMGDPRTVDVHIRHLRKKMSQDGRERDFIETIRGRGYKWK